VFYPLLGEKIYGWQGNVIDVLAVASTLFGLATSLGFGVQQTNAGLNFLFGLQISTPVQVGLIASLPALPLPRWCRAWGMASAA
jgi:choline/glycine/proline betaine transport protein